MSFSLGVKQGTFDGVVANPCGHVGLPATVEVCLNGGILTPGVHYCPTSEHQLFHDAPNALYNNGAVPPDPPYTRLTNGGTRDLFIDTVSGTKVFRKNMNSSAAPVSDFSLFLYQGGLEDTPCGFYVEAEVHNIPGGSHDAIALVIGLPSSPLTSFGWLYYAVGRQNGANWVSIAQATSLSARTPISSDSSFFPAAGSFLRMEVMLDRSYLRTTRLNASRVVVAESFQNLSSFTAVPGSFVGIMGMGSGGSGGGSTSTLMQLKNFKYGII